MPIVEDFLPLARRRALVPIVEDYLPLARRLARRAAFQYQADFDDAYSDALLGWVRALGRSTSEATFPAYAKRCMWGAILDGVRSGFLARKVPSKRVELPDLLPTGWRITAPGSQPQLRQLRILVGDRELALSMRKGETAEGAFHRIRIRGAAEVAQMPGIVSSLNEAESASGEADGADQALRNVELWAAVDSVLSPWAAHIVRATIEDEATQRNLAAELKVNPNVVERSLNKSYGTLARLGVMR